MDPLLAITEPSETGESTRKWAAARCARSREHSLCWRVGSKSHSVKTWLLHPSSSFLFSFKCGEFNTDKKSAALASSLQPSLVAVRSTACTAQRSPSTCITCCSVSPSYGSDRPTICCQLFTTNGAKICGCYINKEEFSPETKIRPADSFFTYDP